MAYDVKVKIKLVKPLGTIDFGYPLILSVKATSPVAYTECKNLESVVEAGYANTTDTYKAAALMFQQENPPAKIAVCGLTASSDLSALNDKEWRQLVLIDGEDADVKNVVTFIANTEKMFFATVENKEGLADLGNGDRVVGFVHSDKLAVAALVGEAAGNAAGSITYKNLMLKGIEPMDYTDLEIDAISAANGITFVTKAGDNVTTEGKAMSGEFVDIIDSKDYVIQQLTYKTQKLLNSVAKVPYDNTGIAMLESVAITVMKDCYNKGIIATGSDGKPAYNVAYDLVENVDPADKLERKYLGGKFSFTLAGAVHTVEINGEILI